MQPIIDYNFLIIGRSGAGKSATSKNLTGDPSITVANSINEVTKSVKFYQGISHFIQSQHVRFGILDIPGLDRIDNRFSIRQIILYQLQRLKISLNGVLYIASMTERDTLEKGKLFDFLEQLPWAGELRKNAVIPILTKYDNLLMDSPQADIQRTKQEFQKIFTAKGYSVAWDKRLFWVNFSKNLDFKMAINEIIRETYQNQIQRLVEVTKRNKKYILGAQRVREYIEAEQKYVLQNLYACIRQNSIPYVNKKQPQKASLNVKILPKKLSEGLTAVSASSIGIIMSKVLQKQFPTPVCVIMMGIPLSLALFNLVTTKTQHVVSENHIFVEGSVLQMFSSPQYPFYQQFNGKLQDQWTKVNNNLQFGIEGKKLMCKILVKDQEEFLFLDLPSIQICQISNQQYRDFEKIYTSNPNLYIFQLPISNLGQEQVLEEERIWDPLIQISYYLKAFDEPAMMRKIERLRIQFGSH